jgi:hypothetical protein
MGLNVLPGCYYDAWIAGHHVGLDAWPVKDNLHKHVSSLLFIL